MSSEKKISVAKINVARGVTAQVHATEEAIDTALAEAAQLMEAYVTARRTLRISATVTGDIHENTLKAMMALNTAQQYMTAAHAGLARLQTDIGIAPNAVVPPFDKPEKNGSRRRAAPVI